MCLNGNCFSFSNYSNKKVAVFISGPGYLEFPWALETAMRLKIAGAKVVVIDLSDFATPYAMRLRIFGRYLPFRARRLFRSFFLASGNRIENVVKKFCQSSGIGYFRDLIPNFHENGIGLIPLNSLKGFMWGYLNAFEICQSTFSSFNKRNLESTDLVDCGFAKNIKHAIEQTHIRVEDWKKQDFDAVFLANGRQPVQAEVTLGFRSFGAEVILYESGGGYIFPTFLRNCLEYFVTNPANSIELREKITCANPIHKRDSILARLVEENVRSRRIIPFKLNYLTEIPSDFDIKHLSVGKNFAFFSTSEWEISILQDFETIAAHKRLFPDQISAVESILSSLEEKDRLFVRLHPSDPKNQADVEEKWKIFENNPKVVLYYPDSRVDSYKLASEMDGNFVWATFLGYELALRDIPVAIVGDAVYASCFGNNWITDYEGLKRFIENPKPITQAMLAPYSNYLAVGGVEIVESETDQQRQVTIDGRRVDTPRKIFSLIPRKLIGAIS